MAENECLDIADQRSGRWRTWRDGFGNRQEPTELAAQGLRHLTKTFSNVQKLVENENEVPLKKLLIAAAGQDGDIEGLVRQCPYARDYVQLIADQAGQGLDEQTICENVLSLTTDRFLDQIGQDSIIEDKFKEAGAFREFRLTVKEEMLDGIAGMAARLADRPETPLRMPAQSTAEKEQQQAGLIAMSIGVGEFNG